MIHRHGCRRLQTRSNTSILINDKMLSCSTEQLRDIFPGGVFFRSKPVKGRKRRSVVTVLEEDVAAMVVEEVDKIVAVVGEDKADDELLAGNKAVTEAYNMGVAALTLVVVMVLGCALLKRYNVQCRAPVRRRPRPKEECRLEEGSRSRISPQPTISGRALKIEEVEMTTHETSGQTSDAEEKDNSPLAQTRAPSHHKNVNCFIREGPETRAITSTYSATGKTTKF